MLRPLSYTDLLRCSSLVVLAVLVGLTGGPLDAQVIQIQGNVQIQGRVVIQNGRIVVGGNEEAADEGIGNSRIFPENRSVTSAIQGARRLIDGLGDHEGKARLERMQSAIDALQQVLDLERDFAYYPSDDDKRYIRSAKAEAEAMLLSLPEDGLALYRSDFGPPARKALDEAVASSDVAGVEEVGRRYFHTEAGYEATYRLGSYHLDRAEPLAAALVFDRVREFAGHLEPMLTLKMAIAWGRAGVPEQSVRTLVDYRRRAGNRPIQLGGRRVALFENESDALPWLVQVLGEQPEFESLGQEQWTMFRGNPARTATTRPASPVWDVAWRYSAIERPGDLDEKPLLALVEKYRKLEKGYRDGQRLTLPAMHAIVVGDQVVFRTLQNIRAVDIASGDTVWESIIDDRGFRNLLTKDDVNPQPRIRNGRQIIIPNMPKGVAGTPKDRYLAQRAWSDLTSGTLASDGRFVYAVEETDFLSGVQFAPNGLMIRTNNTSEKSLTNKLMAFELRTGKLKWELGGPRGKEEFDLAGSFFLGPPLPLGNRLYSLVERDNEIQLAVLEIVETKGETDRKFVPQIQWTQSLIAPDADINGSPLRRVAGLTPSYGDGVMVCPTASGAVVAVDLARRQLAWGYRYRPSVPSVPGNPFMGRRIQTAVQNGGDEEERWLDAVPTIAEGHVVLTPRDSAELHCIDLVTGRNAWDPKPRGDGLYVAGVHDGNVVVVGRSQVVSYRLSDGTPAWSDPIPVGLPSGRGVQAGSLYHLPLADGGIVTIDLDSGRILATSKSPTGHVAGNLVAASGALVSVSPERVIGFAPLAKVEADIDRRLEGAPNDPAALTLRGELRLHQGREELALADLRRAIEAGAEDETRELFVATLLEGLRLDFAKYRDEADAALELIEDADLKRSYLRLHARGLEQIGEHEKAFAEYVQLAGLTSGTPKLETTTNGRLAVRSDRWIRPRLAKLMENAPADHRDAMEKTLASELDAARNEEGPERLRRLVSAFGRLGVADSTRRALADRLDPKAHAVERALVLQRLRRSSDPAVAGPATAELAASALGANRPADALALFDDLRTRFANVACSGDRTGAQLVAEWSRDERIAKAITAAEPWPVRNMGVRTEETKLGVAQSWPVAIHGSAGPFYEDWTFELDNARQNLSAIDPHGRVAWKVTIRDNTRPVANPYGNFVRTRGHVVVACFSTYFSVIDPLHESGNPHVLWSRGLQEPGDNTANVRQTAGPGGFKLLMTDRFGRPLGTVGDVHDDVVYYQVGTRLAAADLLTGGVMWERRNTSRGGLASADDDYVLFVPHDDDESATILRADDGSVVANRRLPRTNERILVDGRRVLSWRTNPKGEWVLALVDVVAGEAIWTTTHDSASRVALVEDEDVAVFEGTGRLQILRIADAKPIVDANLNAPVSLNGITVLRSRDQYLVLPNDPGRNQNNVIRVAGIGFNNPVVHGECVAFDRATGEERWRTSVENQSLPMWQPQGLPLLVLTSRNFRLQRQLGRAINQNQYALMLLDTRTGKVVLDRTEQKSAYPYMFESDPDNGRMTLSFYQRKVHVDFPEPGTDDEEEPAAE